MTIHMMFITSDETTNGSNIIQKSATGDSITIKVEPAIQLTSQNPKMYLMSASIVFVIRNIRSTNNVINISFNNGLNYQNINIQSGIYDLSALQFELNRMLMTIDILYDNAIELIPLNALQKILLKINLPNISINWTNSTIASNLGFQTNGITGPGVAGSTYQANDITKLNTIFNIPIHCSIVSSSYSSVSSDSSILDVVPITVEIGQTINYVAQNPYPSYIFVRTISQMQIYLTNYANESINTNGENWSVVLKIEDE